MKVKIVNESGLELPKYEHPGDAGCDLKSTIDITIPARDIVVIPTGIRVAIPEGYEAKVRPRSGLAAKKKVAAILGTIDQPYRGKIGVILENKSDMPFVVKRGDRIAQLVFSPVVQVEWEETDELDDTDRGEGGFGSTGK